MTSRITSLTRGVATLSVLFVLAACGGGGGGSGSSSSGGSNTPPDTTPNGFTFTSQTAQALSATVISNEITITGINSNAAISITGGEYSIEGGSFTSAAGTIANNQRVRVRLTCSSQFSTAASVSLTVGGVSATFSATTLDADTTPAAFQFAYGANAARNDWITSPAVAITDINTATPVSVVNGEYSIGGGAFTSAPGTISEGQTIAVRVRASAAYSRITIAQLTVGTMTRAFEATSELPVYLPDAVAFDGQDVIYLLNNANRLVFRWSVSQSRYIDPLALADGAVTPTRMAYSPVHRRLYFGYNSGVITQLAVSEATPTETAFASASSSITGIGSAGNFLVVQTSGGYGGGFVYNASGAIVDQGGYYYGYSQETAWDPVTTRLYYTRDGLSPNDLHYDVINQTTGEVTSTNESPYHGEYPIRGPIRVSAGGQYVLLGSGDIYSQQNLNWSGSVAGQIADARWFANGSLVALTSTNQQSTLRRLSGGNLAVVEQLTFSGDALRIEGTDSAMAVLIANAGNLQIHAYVPDDDSDDDGVENTQDAFPLDRAASLDTDGDGHPDAWNSGRGAGDSTTGLALDAFPQDAACWLGAHGSGGTCDYGATIPNYTPDQVVQSGDVVYLLSSANRRVYRWSISGNAYLNPYVVGVNQGFTTLAPTVMALVGAQQRLYLGYPNGAIRYIAVAASSPAEVHFANASAGIYGLANAGSFLAVQTLGGYGSGYLYNSSGAVADQGGYYYGYSRDAEWDPVNARLYYTRDGISPNDLHYDAIDQASGTISASHETPYHGAYNIQSPIRVSANGQYVLLGSGDLYRHSDLNWVGSLGASLTDARWLTNGSIVTLATAANQTTLRRLSATNLTTLEQVTVAGEALRVVGSDSVMVVVVLRNGTVAFQRYTPDDDSDDDGVENTQDAFPLDRAASLDTDRDGYPDAWNTGRTQTDSTTGLVLDAFPQDSACWLGSHGSGGVCNYGATIPNYTPDRVVQHGDVIYLLSSANRRVYRWSISGNAYLNPLVVGINQGFTTVAPTTMTVSPQHSRLYLGYETGAIRYISLTGNDPAELPFANVAQAVYGLAAVGSHVLAQDYSGAWETHYIIDANGAITDQADWNYYSPEYAWDPIHSRVYFYRGNSSPGDLHYEDIDPATGQIAAAGETPYHGDYAFGGVIRPSNDGDYVLLGSGDIYAYPNLTWSGSVGGSIADARWLANGSVVTLSVSGNQTTLRRRGGANLAVLEQLTFTGQALRVVGSDAAMVLVISNNGALQFHSYVPNDDSDGDGVTNTQDAFPLDVAASADTDRDGFPDAWNAGRSQADSSTGLTLDAFPNDAACWLSAHGSGGVCNYGATIPNYLPDQVAQDGDVVYLLSAANRRVYRWSISGEQYMNPYVVGIDQGFSTISPTRMTYSSAHDRLYLGYANGAIRYIDLAAATPVESSFMSLAQPVQGLAAVGNYVLAQDSAGPWETHYVINSSGAVTDQQEWNHYSPEYAWDPVHSRVYFYSMWSPSDLNYERIDQATGQITGAGETPYHGTYGFGGVIRVSVNGQQVLVGTGDVYNQNGLSWGGSLGGAVADARWMSNGTLVTLTSAGNQTVLRRRGGSNLALLEQLTFNGQPLRVVGSDAAMVVLVNDGGTVQFLDYVPNDDVDGDGVTNTSDAFPMDVAASVDSDLDGYPNAWNAGRTQADSTTGLTLDAFPNDAACWLASHGSGGVCNQAATMPNYLPDQVVNNGNVIYLLSTANKRVYRWSMTTAEYLSPYVVGINLGLNTIAPTRMAFSPGNNRLYLGYGNGAIQYLDVNAANPVEVPFATAASAIYSLGTAGSHVVTQASIYDASGTLTGGGGYYYGYSRETAWDPVSSRLYYTRDGLSPNDLHYDVINPATGTVTSQGETPYHGTYSIAGPIRVSPDGERVLLGSGDIYARNGLTWAGSLGKYVTDAHWTGNILVDVDTTDRVEIRDANTRAVLQSYQYTGTPIRVLFGQTETYLVHVLNNTAAFIRLPFYDQDADTIPRWWEQRYGLSDSNAADATLDPDGDGLDNAAEYANHSNPQVADTDGDGLGDAPEVSVHHSDPTRADTDGDGLGDGAEVNTHHSNPLDADSDDDGYNDLVEVQYGGNPNDVSELPVPLSNYSQGFEGSPDLSAWTMPSGEVPWAIDTTLPRSGAASFKSGPVANSQFSVTRFRAFFSAGQLSFWTRTDAGSCCNRLTVSVDGTTMIYAYGNGAWNLHTLNLTLGVHDIEWRFDRDYYGGTTSDGARIDDLVFTAQ